LSVYQTMFLLTVIDISYTVVLGGLTISTKTMGISHDTTSIATECDRAQNSLQNDMF
jgi:hypothetical protein